MGTTYLTDGDDLTSVANAIRAKSGGSSQLAFPAGFVSEIQAIPTGGADTLKGYVHREHYGDYIDDTIDKFPQYIFSQCSPGFDEIRVPNCTEIARSAFYLCGGDGSPTLIFAPKATIGTGYGGSVFYGCNRITTVVAKNLRQGDNFRKYSLEMLLATVDLTNQTDVLANNTFKDCVNLTTLILRNTTPFGIQNLGAFSGTPFDSGGSGGTIYIPKSLYDHLGDGTASDYKTATNWSTIDGYGTITWAKIEGSIYENAYADGTAISS